MSDEAISKAEAENLITTRVEHIRFVTPITEKQRGIIDTMISDTVKSEIKESLQPIALSMGKIQTTQQQNMKWIAIMIAGGTLVLGIILGYK